MRAIEPKPHDWRDHAKVQHGVVTRQQLLASGLSSSAVNRLVAKTDLRALHRGVYLVAGHQHDWVSSLIAATLVSEGHASHRSAAKLWDLLDDRAVPVEVTTPGQPRDERISWHRRLLPPCDTTTVRGIPVTSIHRTLIDLGDVADRQLVEDALDRALERRMTSSDWLLSRIGDLGT
jgi:predicted transcriptional regulator of viral defense system